MDEDQNNTNHDGETKEEGTAHSVKRLRINEQAEFISTRNIQENSHEGEGEGDGDENSGEEICSLCMEVGTEDCPILENHQCPQCAKDAWKICQCCNESLLSRTCPVCRGEYAPIVMYLMPGLPLSALADQSLSEEDKTNLLYKFGVVRHLIGKSNICIWSPVTNRMHFSLPQKIQSGNTSDQSYALVSIAMTEDKLTGDTFDFTNKVWDEIENEVETGEVTAGEIVEQQKAIQSILSITKHPGHKLYTMLSEDDWQYMLDPSESPDTSEALKAIKSTIFKPVLPQFQSTN
mmetsp:Transcript_14110/g.15296  ORF Transcript_14110/g.15296 Transcript_14110/m.15296 type:complete len:291 (+) Transcript_14110:75-947(+)|eukprot:gene1225-1299_t